MPGSKLYIVNSTDMIAAVQRHPKALAFAPIEAKFAMTICKTSQEANDILNRNVNGEEGDWGLMIDFYKSIHPALAPGGGLDAMNRIMIQNIACSLENLNTMSSGSRRIRLNEWCRHEITMTTTNSVYGHQNPFKDRAIEDAFWIFAKDCMMLVANIMPSLTARKAHRSRRLLSKSFENYFENKGHEFGSMLVQKRYETGMRNKVPLADIARHEIGGSLVMLVNTTPAVFWMLFYVFSRPDVLEDCREEVTSIMEIRESDNITIRTIDITSVKQNCPILTSTFQEVLRQRGLGNSLRQVMQDTLLDNKYLLKEGSTVLMPSIVIHTDPSVWGDDVDVFHHKRFLGTSAASKRKLLSSAAFRGFGGGSTLCPGRHFATLEILSTVMMFIMRYEMTPVSGEWATLSNKFANIAAVVTEPDHDIEVDVTPRKGFEGGRWEFGLQDSGIVFAMVAEDKNDP